MEDKKITAKELAEKLEAHAAQLRELSDDELDGVGGGGIIVIGGDTGDSPDKCCGENCNTTSSWCEAFTWDSCKYSCVKNSPT